MSPSPRRRLLQLASPAARLTAYLREAGRRGAAAVYWNAAPVPLEVALRRAGRLQPGADVDLLEWRVLVVEPLRRPRATRHVP